MALTVRSWTGLDGLRGALHAWPELLAETGADPLCNDPEWTLCYATSWLEDDQLFGWTLEEDGRPLAVLALRKEPRRGPLALPRALHATDGTFDSDYLVPWIRSGREEEAIELLLAELSKRDTPVQAVVLAGLPDDSPTLLALRTALAQRSLPYRERSLACLSMPLPPSFEGFLDTLGRRMRSKVRQARRRAEELGAELVWCDDPSRLAADLQGLFDLHAKRWTAAGQPGSFAEPKRRDFYARLARLFFTRSDLRFARLELDGEPVAYQFGARRGGTYYQLQEGFEPGEERLRLGTALRAWVIERLIDEGLECYDFMAGDSHHKRDWGACERPCTTLAFALPRWRARLAYGLRAWADRRV